MAKVFYLTTPLYYVNASPHIGHSYTEVAADCLARYQRLKLGADKVWLLTGTDEHGQKIEQAAAAAGKPPKEFVDEMVKRFTDLWKLLGISHNDFIRTTEPRHTTVVQTCLTQLRDKGELHHATYQGWYCTPCETFWTSQELAESAVAGTVSTSCPTCQRPLEAVSEEGWYLPLEKHRLWLQQFLATHPTFVRPETRYNEIASLVNRPLPEYLCITRPRQRVSWGIPVPFSDQHVTYVWFDALLNYISAVGYQDPKHVDARWPADVHVIGKDILRHHAVYWPIILHALGLDDEQMPRMILAHGWWKIGEQKMSKSLGNIVDPSVVVRQFLKHQPYAADVYRYFLLREVPFGQDGVFSEEAILTRLNADLANDLGNLVNRTLSMIERYRQGTIPASRPLGELNTLGAAAPRALAEEAIGLPQRISGPMSHLQFSEALAAVMQVVSKANQFIEAAAPWKLAKEADGAERLDQVLSALAEVIRIVAITLEPFMPSVSAAIWEQLGMGRSPRRLADAARWPALQAGQPLGKRDVLFPKTDAAA